MQENSSTSAPGETRRTEEMLVCATHGEVLYEWQCGNIESRISLLESLAQQAQQLGLALPLGKFKRIEIESAADAVVCKIDRERAVFVRSSKSPASTA